MNLPFSTKLFAGVALLAALTACVDTFGRSLSYSSATDNGDQFEITPNCIQSSSLKEGEGSQYISYSYKDSPECFGKFNAWITGHKGQKVVLFYGKDRVIGPAKVITRLGSNNIRLFSQNPKLLPEINDHLSNGDK